VSVGGWWNCKHGASAPPARLGEALATCLLVVQGMVTFQSDQLRYVDLHLHTLVGWPLGAAPVVDEAAASGLAAIAITDTTSSRATEAAQRRPSTGCFLPGSSPLTGPARRSTCSLRHRPDEPDPDRGARSWPRADDGARRVRPNRAQRAGTPLTLDDLSRYRVRYPAVRRSCWRWSSRASCARRRTARAPQTREPGAARVRRHEAIELITRRRDRALAHPAKIRKDQPHLTADDLTPLRAA